MSVLLTLVLILGALLVAANLWTRRLTRRGADTVPQAGQIVPVNGGSIHYVELGDPSAQSIVLIHGLTGQLQHFTYAMADILARDFHVIALDRPGCGYSTRDNARLATLPEQARMIQEFLDAKGVQSPVLVGHSLGGAVSLAMALDYQDKPLALALLAPLTQFVDQTPAIFKPLEIRTEWLRALIGIPLPSPWPTKPPPMSSAKPSYPNLHRTISWTGPAARLACAPRPISPLRRTWSASRPASGARPIGTGP